jgi:hypothetical protein
VSKPGRIKGAYYRPSPGEWIEPASPRKRGYRLACCDCGLTHTLKFRVNKKTGKIEFCVFRANRSTAMLRRHAKIEDYENVLLVIRNLQKREAHAPKRKGAAQPHAVRKLHKARRSS